MTNPLTCNKSISLSQLDEKVKRSLKGVASFIDNKGAVKGYFIDLNSWEDLLEDMESTTPEFFEEIKKSKLSGRVSSLKIKKSFRIK